MRMGVFWIMSIMALATGALAQSPTSLISDVALEGLGFQRRWEANLPIAPGSSIERAYLVDEALYVTTTGGAIFSVEADVGLIRWVDELTEPDFTIYRPTHRRTPDGHGPVVVLTTNGAFVIDRYTGARLTRFDPGFAPGGAPLSIGSNYFAGSNDGRFHALVISGQPRARIFNKWEVLVGSAITATPILYEGDKLLFASEGGGVYSCFASDKTLLWSYRTGGGIVADPAIDAGGVYVASVDRTLYKLSLGGGHRIWRVRFGDPLREGPVAVAHSVFQYSLGRGLVALDADSGTERWANVEARRFVAHSRGRDVLYSADHRLLIVDHETGAAVGAMDMPDAIGVVTNTESDAVYVLGTEGRVLCLRIDDVPYLRRQQVQAARARLNQAPADHGAFADVPNATSTPTEPAQTNPLRSWRDREPK